MKFKKFKSKAENFCPVCEIRKLKRRLFGNESANGSYSNGAALTPPMGWSSWNLFARNINENLIKEIAVSLELSGLKDKGYTYVNIDDCWQASQRDEFGRLQPDRQTFSAGMRALADFLNERGMKLGLYSSNGSLTCEDFPGSLYHERVDAKSIAEWGTEYFKYDFCHNEPINGKAPLVSLIEVADKSGCLVESFAPVELVLSSGAFVDSSGLLSGLDYAGGEAFFKFNAETEGEYALTFTVKKQTGGKRFLLVTVNTEAYCLYSNPAAFPTGERREQIYVHLQKGENLIFISTPIAKKSDSAALQYSLMGKELKRAAELQAEKEGREVKPIVFSICEWGRNKPYKWGAHAGNLWRTTPDIKPFWTSIMLIYEHNVKLDKYARPGAWNDPDMLEVGNGNLTFEECRTHFALWCMMAAPLILGCDTRKFVVDGKADEGNRLLQLLKNDILIAIDQDKLGIQAKRIKTGLTDVLVKPLTGGRAALLLLNKRPSEKKESFELTELFHLSNVNLERKNTFAVTDAFDGKRQQLSSISVSLPPHSARVYMIE